MGIPIRKYDKIEPRPTAKFLKEPILPEQGGLPPVNRDAKYLYKVSLNAQELDKFIQIKQHASLHITTVFYCDS